MGLMPCLAEPTGIQHRLNSLMEKYRAQPREYSVLEFGLARKLTCDKENYEKNKSRIEELLKSSADAGFTDALVYYASLYFDEGFPSLSPERGIALLTTAKDHGEALASFLLGKKYLHGFQKPDYPKIAPDYSKALAFFQDYYQADVTTLYLTEILTRMNKETITHEEGLILIEHFEKLKSTITEISSKHHVEAMAKENKFAHYTTLKALQNILPMQRKTDDMLPCLALSHLASMDDPYEGRAIIGSDDKSLIHSFFKNLSLNDKIEEESAFCISLTDKIDNLDLWRLYSRGNNYSVCLVFDPIISGWSRQLKKHSASNPGYCQQVSKILPTESESRDWCYIKKVCYSDEKTAAAATEINKRLEPISQFCKELACKPNTAGAKEKKALEEFVNTLRRCVRVLLYEIIYLYKKEAYSHESERRIITLQSYASDDVGVIDNSADGLPKRLFYKKGIPLYQHTLSKIIISPAIRDREAAIADIKCRLAKHGISSVRVCTSDQPSVAKI